MSIKFKFIEISFITIISNEIYFCSPICVTTMIKFYISSKLLIFFQVPIVPVIFSSYQSFLDGKNKRFDSGKAISLDILMTDFAFVT